MSLFGLNVNSFLTSAFRTGRTATGGSFYKTTFRYKFSTSATRCQQTDTVEADFKENNTIDPLSVPDYFKLHSLFTTKDLFQANVHLGHNSGLRDKHMCPFIFGNRLGTDILNLDLTAPLLRNALNFTAHIASRAGVILLISRHLQTLPLVEKMAEDCGEYSHCREWKLGTFSNANVQFGAITRLPDLCIFFNTHDSIFAQHEGIVEATKMNIPTIGIVDSASDPRLITYPVPGNDETPSAVELYCKLFKYAIMKGKEMRPALVEQGYVE